MSPQPRLFLILCLAGLAGVLSFQLVDLRALIDMFPETRGQPLPMAAVRLLAVLQPAVLVAIAAFGGVRLAPRVGLSAPVAQALAEKRPLLPALGPQLLPGVLGAAVAAPSILACWLGWTPFLSASFVNTATEFNRLLPPLTRLLYGGITEEVLLRGGFMTVIVWAAWKGFQQGRGEPRPSLLIAAIVVSAIVFGAGHLPVAIALDGGASLPLVAYVIVANSIFGVVGGVLYWKKGLESAVIAHALTHVGFLLSGLM